MTGSGSDLARPGPVPATRPAPWDYAAPWGTRGYITDLGGPVYWIEFAPDHGRNQPATQATGQPEAQDRNEPPTQDRNEPPTQDRNEPPAQEPEQPGALPPIVFVHGLGGSHLNWCLLGPNLTAGRRVVALDLRGFGLTPGLRVNSTVQANARLLDRFITEVIGTPVILVGNSMGGLITILETAANPDAIDGVVLIDPALPLPLQKPDWEVSAQFLVYALPGLGDLAVAKGLSGISPEAAVQRLLQLCFADPSRADPEMVKAEVALAARRRPATPAQASARARVFLASTRSLLRVLGRRQRYARMMAGIDVPVLLIGGDADRLVPVAAIRQAGARNPRWETVILAGVGHTPQLEVPGAVAVAIRDWLDRHAT
jgi:pimeloyl-ACP methyl ester carboxylesterase